MHILLVEDDTLLADGLSAGLSSRQFRVDIAGTVQAAKLGANAPGLEAIVLDWMLPDGSGLDLLAYWRANAVTIPILMLSSKGDYSDRVTGLNAGADDYLPKPFDLDELAARLRALSRRTRAAVSTAITLGSLVMDPSSQHATWRGKDAALSRREFSLLYSLMHEPARTFSRDELCQLIYGPAREMDSNTVDVHIHHIRTKLGLQLIRTVRGQGYRIGIVAK